MSEKFSVAVDLDIHDLNPDGGIKAEIVLSIHKYVDGNQEQFCRNTLSYFNVPDDALSMLRDLVFGWGNMAEELKVKPLTTEDPNGNIDHYWAEIARDEMMIIEQIGIHVIETLGNLGISQQDDKNLDKRHRAKGVMKLRKQGLLLLPQKGHKKEKKEKKDE